MKYFYPTKPIKRLLPSFLFFAFTVLEAPVLSHMESASINYIPGTGNVVVSKKIDIVDQDSEIQSASIVISEGFVSDEDQLSARSFEGITSSWDSTSGTLTLIGAAKVATYKQALRSVQYLNNDTSDPTLAKRVISFTVKDSTESSNSLSRTINIVDPTSEPQPAPKPEASISGSEKICQEDTAQLDIAFKGTPPFDVTVMKDHSVYKELDNIQTLTYTIEVNTAGTYTLSNLKDANNDGTTSGTATVSSYPLPTADISGNKSLCGGGQTELSVVLTGNAPWRFSYRLNSGTPVLVQDVTAATGTISVNKQGTYSLVEVYDQYCKGTVSGTAIVEFTAAPEVSIKGIGTSYSNASNEWYEISGNPTGGEFSGNGILHYQNKWYFLPSLAHIGINMIVYKYRSSPDACYGYDTLNVRIFETTAEIIFDRERTTFCSNDAPFTVKGESITSKSSGKFNISGGNGLTDNGNNTATIDPSLLQEGEFTITYTAADGVAVERKFEVGQPLHAAFAWETECFTSGESISFVNTSTSPFGFLNDDSFVWEIFSKKDSIMLTSKNISYHFPEPGNYIVELTASNSNGCTDTVRKLIPLRPVVELANQNYSENFEDEASWFADKDSDNTLNSWTLGTPQKHGSPPQGFSKPFSGDKSWFTDIIQNPVPQEKSWIKSPCFNFTGTEKPTFVAHVWRLFTDNRDGANLEYTTDGGKSWFPVGDLNDGINWFTGYYGSHENQSVGWTSVYDTGWVEIRHKLDFLKNESEVQFRFKYDASGNAIGNDGIAIDNVKVIERNRTVLLEHFTNSSDKASAKADSTLNTEVELAGENVIALQYHTAEPGEDPLNKENPLIPGARQFYYSVNDVPFTIINGGLHPNQRIDYSSNSLNDDKISIESLYDSDFNLDVTSMIQDDTLYVEAALTSLFNIPLRELAVRIAVFETEIEDPSGSGRIFRNVVKTIVPDVAGEILYRSWNEDETLHLFHYWGMENVYDEDNIRAVAFIQDEGTKEVLQAAIGKRGIVTANSNTMNPENTDILLYPNPARSIAYLNFKSPLKKDIRLDIINNLGQIVWSSVIPEGTSMQQIPAGNWSAGLYMVQLSDETGMIRNLKLMTGD